MRRDSLIPYRECYYRLRVALEDRIEHWEADANDAEYAANTYERRDEAAVELFRQANRSRARARELRAILAEGGAEASEKPSTAAAAGEGS